MAENIADLRADRRIAGKSDFVKKTGARVLCSAPVRFLDRECGALTVYRNEKNPFTDEQFNSFRSFASLIPNLYRSILDRVSFGLVEAIYGILKSAERCSTGEEAKAVVKSICLRVGEAFQALETTVYLTTPQNLPRRFQKVATTFEAFIRKNEYSSDEPGLTPWVLKHGTSVSILDLGYWDQDKDAMQRDYAGISWRDELKVLTLTRQHLGLSPKSDLQPLSFMAAPVLIGDTVLGVIRCFTAKEPPFFYSRREHTTLQLAAAQIGHFWSGWLKKHESDKQRESWNRLLDNVSDLNRFVREQLSRERPDARSVFDRALKIAGAAVPGLHSSDIRFYNADRRELSFEAFWGRPWRRGGPKEITLRKARIYPVEGDTIAAKAFRTRELQQVDDVQRRCGDAALFPDVRRMIIAPIVTADRAIGLLDLRTTQEFQPHTTAIAGLIARQIGLYWQLIDALREQKQMFEKQTRVYADLGHQLKTPILRAQAYVREAMQADSLPGIKVHLSLSRASLSEASRVAASTRLLADLAEKGLLHAKLEPIGHADLLRFLEQSAQDHEVLVDKTREIYFEVHQKAFEAMRPRSIQIDLNLFKQALSNVLDNASKYSYPASIVEISGKMVGAELEVSVSSRGLSITEEELSHCVEHGWRGEETELSVGEGTGVGLWIADNVMKAHGGELHVCPTDPQSVTRVNLLFPTTECGI